MSGGDLNMCIFVFLPAQLYSFNVCRNMFIAHKSHLIILTTSDICENLVGCKYFHKTIDVKILSLFLIILKIMLTFSTPACYEFCSSNPMSLGKLINMQIDEVGQRKFKLIDSSS